MPQELGFKPDVVEGNEPNYLAAGASVEYVRDEGLLQVPLAKDPTAGEPNPECAVVRTHAPVGQRVVRFSAEAAGNWSRLPSPRPRPGEALLFSSRTPHLPQMNADGTVSAYRVDVLYVFAQLRAPAADDGLETGTFPHSATPKSANYLPAERYSEEII